MDLLSVEDKLRELVRQATNANRRVSRGVVSPSDFAAMWLAARSMGVVQRDSNTPSAPTKLRYHFYEGRVKVTVRPSPWCPDGEAGVA